MRKLILLLLLASLWTPALCLAEAAEPQPVEVTIDEIGVTTTIPAGWTVVTPETVSRHFEYFDEITPEKAAEAMRAEGVYLAAFNAAGDAALRVIAREGDETAKVYRDISRYTPEMRAAIKDDFLDRAAWALTGYRYTEAAWTNRENQGRILNLTYLIRFGETTTHRGLQAYTIRNGLHITLDLQVEGRRVESADQRAFDAMARQTLYPMSLNMPKLPVGLTVTGGMPEEAVKPELTLHGATMRGATVEAWLKPSGGQASVVGSDKAGSGGDYEIELTLPGAGEYELFLIASLEGYANSDATGILTYEPGRIPIDFTSAPSGDYFEPQVAVEGKTLAGVTVQCMEFDTNKRIVTGSDGRFSFKLDRGVTGVREVTLAFTKKGFTDRRVDIVFNRKWRMADYAAYLKANEVQPLSYANLAAKADKYAGRIVQYTGQVISVSTAGTRHYVQLALKVNKSGAWSEGLVAVRDGEEIALAVGDRATLYVEVTTDTSMFSSMDENGNQVDTALPMVMLLAYVKADE